jgi:hypothetical protein
MSTMETDGQSRLPSMRDKDAEWQLRLSMLAGLMALVALVVGLKAAQAKLHLRDGAYGPRPETAYEADHVRSVGEGRPTL